MSEINTEKLPKIPQHHFNSLKKIEEGYWWYEGRIIWASKFILNWLEKNHFTDPTYYADLGCGTGGFGLAIKNKFDMEDVVLVDNNPDALNKISKAACSNVLALDLETDFSLPFHPNLITCMDVIEHLKEDDLFLSRLFKILKPGGLLVISTAAHPFLYSSWDKKLGHYRRYSKSALVAKLTLAGFKITEAYYGWSFLFPAAPYRFMSSHRQEKLEYPVVPRWLNQTLIAASKWESKLSTFLPFPFGTSVFIAASRESK